MELVLIGLALIYFSHLIIGLVVAIGMRKEIRTAFGELKTEVHTSFGDLKTEVQSCFDELKEELRSCVNTVRERAKDKGRY